MKKLAILLVLVIVAVGAFYRYSSALIDPESALRGLALIIQTSEKQEASTFKSVRKDKDVTKKEEARPNKPINKHTQELMVSGAVAILIPEE